eukprot:gene5061-173_t
MVDPSTKAGKRGFLHSASSYQGSDCFYAPYLGRGKVLFTGPDGVKDHETKICDAEYIGIGTASRESTGNLSYLWRAATHTPHPSSRGCQVGDIGWHSRGYMDRRLLSSRQQIKLGEFREACENRYSHRNQNPWYPESKRFRCYQKYSEQRDSPIEELKQIPIRPRSCARPKSTSTIGSLPFYGYKRRPDSPSSSSSSSYR